MINYLIKFSPSTANICEPQRSLISVQTEWTWDAAYQKLFYKAKSVINEAACMKFQATVLKKLMHLKWDWELAYYKPELVEASQ